MSLLSESERPRAGLRERKKARTRASIQQEAMRLFAEQGYSATTIDQIAEAAEISQSTFFRYFPTKEDLMVQDDLDAFLIEAFRAQPAELSPIQALRKAFLSVHDDVSPDVVAQERQRHALILSVPELRAAMLNGFTDTINQLGDLVAERVSRRPDEFVVRNFAGAVIGVMMSAMIMASADESQDFFLLMEAGLAHLEAGLPI
jgi:AcrR family transcriptional regulator